TPGGYHINQFGNPDNPAAHEEGTGPEILRQMAEVGGVDAVVVGVGSGGTITGLANCFAKQAPQVELILADPAGSILAGLVQTGELGKATGSWLVEGIGEGSRPPPVADFRHVHTAYAIDDRESFLTARELLRTEGILGGSSTGTLLAAALRWCREQTEPKKILVFVCDTGNKYLSKLYNDYWMLDNGFIEREQHGDLRDLILRPYSQRDTVVLAPGDLLMTAYQRMKLYEISQLPVMDGDTLVGILDESDVLMHVFGNEERFKDPVSTAMVTSLEKLDVGAPVQELIPVFERGHVAIVTNGDRFLGLITRIDLLNYLRRRVHCRRCPPAITEPHSMTTEPSKQGLGTRAIHAGQSPDPSTGAVMTPIYATSTYVQSSPGVHQGFEYSRSHNPTRFAYEDCVAALEGGTRGYAFASGLAATSTVLDVLDSGSHVICMDDVYGGTFRLFERVRKRSAGLEFSFVDLGDADALAAAVRPNTKLIWAETPTNPMLKV